MSLSAREQQALDCIEDELAGSDPKLAWLLATFARHASGEEMPVREKIPNLTLRRGNVHQPARRLFPCLGLQQTMLQALKEIEDNRSDLVSGAVQVQRLGGALDASNHALRLSSELYKGGATDFLDVLAAQEAYLRDAESLNQAKREHALAAVALYRSLGGGWDVPETVTAASAN